MANLNKRASGVLMPVFSLPGNTGIGTMGEYAYKFIDKLKSAGQTYWQVLPIGTTGFGNSPYQSFSSFAGNPYFIDLEFICKKGYLKKRDYTCVEWCSQENKIDYGIICKERPEIFAKMFENFLKHIPEDFYEFAQKEKGWLDDYALFMAIKQTNGNVSLFSWENERLKKRDKSSLRDFENKHSDEILYHKMLQYFFFEQWYDLKKYANSNNISIIGDIPFYVSSDSVEVWTNPEYFCIDDNFNIEYVAGCPPDAFSPEGQLWGNVLYNWNNIKKSGYSMWLRRLEFTKRMYDVIRIDHFKAFESYYSIDFSSKSAKGGKWIKGPGIEFFNKLKEHIGKFPIIAEDLGFKTEELELLLKECGFPGMSILQFAFDSGSSNEYLPHNVTKNSVVYTGTHDNDTLLGWILSAEKEQIKFAKEYFRTRGTTQLLREMVLAALSSVSDLCILPLQDLIGLDSSARINVPSTLQNNWQWRATHEQLKNIDYENLLRYTKLYGRIDN